MPGATPFLPSQRGLAALADAVQCCRGCPLWEDASRAVFGEGPPGARWMLVGEQPGFEEDKIGRPFVGPAGRLLDRALADAGIDRGAVYVTNVVKHFRSEPRGKRRLHKRAGLEHVDACAPWIQAEIAEVRPEVIVCLGSLATQALVDRKAHVTQLRGTFLDTSNGRVFVTVHPSAILRVPDDAARHAAYTAFVADLRVLATTRAGTLAPAG